MILSIFEAFACSVALSFFLRIPLGVALILYPSAIILILYGSDFVGLLHATSICLHVLSVFAFALWMYSRIREPRAPFTRRQFLVASVCLFALLQAAIFCSTREFYSWDEFSHWGTIIRAIHGANTFHFTPNPLYFMDYPPGLALFSYHMLQLTGYSEAYVYFSYALLLACFSASLVELAARGTTIGFLASVIAVWCLANVLGPGWASVLIDHMLAFYFGGIIAAYFLLRESGSSLFTLPIVIAAFVLTKQAALSFALLASAMIFFDWLLTKRLAPQQSAWTVPRLLSSAGALGASLVGAALLTSKSWTTYVAQNSLGQSWGTYTPSKHFHDFLNCCVSPRETTVAAKFFAAFWQTTPASAEPAPLAWFATDAMMRGWTHIFSSPFSKKWLTGAPGIAMTVLLLASLALILSSRHGPDRWRNATFVALLTVGAGGYTLSLLTTYLYAFSEYEAQELASFDRFLGVYVLAWALALLAAAFATYNHLAPSARLVASSVVALAICVTFFSKIVHARPVVTKAGYTALYENATKTNRLRGRQAIRDWVATFQDVPANSNVFIAWPRTVGLEFWLTKHELLPRVTNLVCFAFTKDVHPALVQECTMSESQLQGTLADYDYVAIGDNLDAAKAEYPRIFAQAPSGRKSAVFKVVHTPSFGLTPLRPQHP